MLTFRPKQLLEEEDLFYQLCLPATPEVFVHVTDAVAAYARLIEPLSGFVLSIAQRATIVTELVKSLAWLIDHAPLVLGEEMSRRGLHSAWMEQVQLVAHKQVERTYTTGYHMDDQPIVLGNAPVEDLGGDGDYQPLTMQANHWQWLMMAAVLCHWASDRRPDQATELADGHMTTLVRALAHHYPTLGQAWENNRYALLCDDDAVDAAPLWEANVVSIAKAWRAAE